jgi:fido (protein-threonine AMPylation protein)
MCATHNSLPKKLLPSIIQVELLLLILTYILDILCIHPFLDGTGRMAKLLTLHLLYKAGYEVGCYISLEQMVEQTKEGSYDMHPV